MSNMISWQGMKVGALLTFVGLLCAALALIAAWQAAVAVIASIGLTAVALRHYVRRLSDRMVAADGPTWSVAVNGVHVGVIADADYASILRRCATAPALYVAQASNFLHMLWVLVAGTIRGLPIALCWLSLLLWLNDPQALRGLVTAAAQATPAEAQASLRSALGATSLMLGFLAGWFIVVATVTHRWDAARRLFGGFGFVDRFEQHAGESIRWSLSVPATGEISLQPLDLGVVASAAQEPRH